MPRFTPDPSFYATATQAATAPPERLAYVATIGVGQNGDTPPDALGVLDLDPASSSYGQIVSRLEMPNVGDELHHFGWNACSSALCPWMPHPHVERRYLRRAGAALVARVRARHRRTTRASRGSSRRSSRRRSRARPATAARTPCTAGPTASTSTRSATPTATARAASSSSTTTRSRSRARGSATAARRSSPTTSGGTSATTA